LLLIGGLGSTTGSASD